MPRNKIAISALSVVWIWLRPELPNQLVYVQKSVVSYDLYTLVKSIRYKQKKYEKYYYDCIESMKSCQYEINYVVHMYDSNPIDLNDFDKFIENLNNELKNYKEKIPRKKNEYDMLKFKANFVVNTLTPLHACCYGMYKLLLV